MTARLIGQAALDFLDGGRASGTNLPRAGFLDRYAARKIAPTGNMIGQTLGHYRIVEQISGGMERSTAGCGRAVRTRRL